MELSYHIQKYYEEYATDEEKAKINTYYYDYKVKDLRQFCKVEGIKQYSYRNKDELCLMLATGKTVPEACCYW